MKFNKFVFITSALIPSLFLISCTKETVIEKQAPDNMLESFNRSATSVCKRTSCITIQKAALKKDFLLMASGRTGGSTPQWLDMKPLVISFEKSGGKVALLNENQNSIYSEIRSVNLIQTFDIVSEDDKTITFDWGQGFKTFIAQSPFDVDGIRENGTDLMESTHRSIPVIDSFIRNIKFDEKNIELEQVSKIHSNVIKAAGNKKLDAEDREETLAMNIQIRSYNLGPNYKTKEFDKSRRVGFFVTKIAKEKYSKDVTNLITKWDLSPSKGPILVRISKTVPDEYVESIKEAVYYWNKVFGRDVLVAQPGVDPQEGPQERSIFIRWIPWLDSGAAYASGQSDPLTGELLRAQIFMPSVFTRVGSAKLVQMNNNVPVAIGAVACDLTKAVLDLNKLARDASPSQILRLAQDGVRATVAHELGHTLGLRHNFAGSFSSKVFANEIFASAKSYLKDLHHQGLETSTSIMDYVTGIDEILMSARIKNAPLSYDKMAMDWAYSDNDSDLSEEVSKYCTDDDIGLGINQGLQVYGCERFDAGNNPLLRKYLEAKSEVNNFANVLFASIMGRLYPFDEPGVVKNIDDVLADTQKWGKANLDSLKFVSQVIMETTKNAKPAPAFASLEYIKAGQVELIKAGRDKAFQEEREKSLAEIGGYSAIFDGLWRQEDGSLNINWLQKEIDELKKSPYLGKGTTLGGRNYELSLQDQEKVLGFYKNLLAVNKKALVSGLEVLLPKIEDQEQAENGKIVTVSSVLPQNSISINDSVSLANLFLGLVALHEGTEVVKVGAGLAKEITLEKPFLTSEERIQWMKVLSSKGLRFDMEGKKALARKDQYEKINAFLKEVDAQLDLSTVTSPSQLAEDLLKQGLVNATAAEWLASEINVLVAMDKLN